MTFKIRNLSVLSYANGFTLWHYKADNGPIAPVEDGSFWTDTSHMLSTGDIILVSGKAEARQLLISKEDLNVTIKVFASTP